MGYATLSSSTLFPEDSGFHSLNLQLSWRLAIPRDCPDYVPLCLSPGVIRATAVFSHGVWRVNSNHHAYTARVLTTEQFPQPKFCFPDTEMIFLNVFWILIFHPMYGLPIFSLLNELSLSLLSLGIVSFLSYFAYTLGTCIKYPLSRPQHRIFLLGLVLVVLVLSLRFKVTNFTP